MQTRQEAIQYCHSFKDVYEDYPFHDDNWCVMRHKKNKKTYALIYDKDGHIWINVKCVVLCQDLVQIKMRSSAC